MRLVFAGTPSAAVPSLDALAASTHEVVAVITRPDAPAGRGRTVSASPVRKRAADLGIPVLTPVRTGDPAFLDHLRDLAPDAAPIVAYGGLIPPAALEIPRLGWVNLHFSLLPAWRGAAPVQRALMAGDDITGATTFRLERGLDTGPTFGVMTERVRPSDTAGDLLDRLAVAGAGLLVTTLDGLQRGDIEAVPQPANGVSLAPKVTVEEARVPWQSTAYAIDRLVRACTPAPGAWTTFRGQRVKLQPVSSSFLAGQPPDRPALAPGELAVGKQDVYAGAANGQVRLGLVQPHGKKAMDAAAWARGVRVVPGERFDL